MGFWQTGQRRGSTCQTQGIRSRHFLSWHIHFHFGSDEKRGLAKFIELLRKHGAEPIHQPKFVV
jgi:hypothetical protein